MQAGILSRTVGFFTGASTRINSGLLPVLPTPAAHFVRSGGEQLAYDEYGSRQGYPLFYFHDAGSSRLECGLFHRAARQNNYRLIAIDRPGIGCSDYYSSRDATDFCRDVLQLADQLGITKFGVLSLGAGGIFAVSLAHLAPHRVSLQLNIAGIPGSVFNEGKSTSMAASFLQEVTPAFVKIMVRLRHAFFPDDPQESIEQLLDYLSFTDRKTLLNPRILQTLELDQAEAVRNGPRGIAQDLAICFRKFDFRLSDIQVPVIIWQGCADRLSSRSDCEYLVARMPNASFYRVPNRGHYFFVHCMDEVFARLQTDAQLDRKFAA